MTDIFWTKELLPENNNGLDLNKLCFREARYFNGLFVSKGTIIGTIYTERWGTPLCKVITPETGFIKCAKPDYELGGFAQYSPGSVLYTINTFEERLDSLKMVYKIQVDPFSGEKRIIWDQYFKFDSLDKLYFDFVDGVPCLSIQLWSHHHKPKMKETFSLLFSDKEVRTFLIKTNPIKDISNKEYTVNFEIKESDLNKMISVPLLSCRFDSKTVAPYTFNIVFFDSAGLGQSAFRKAASKFSEALDEIGFKWPSEELQETAPTDESCYVYLMVDSANGYHKIGISNHPEYREGTLQSEKPTIELLCAKQFPSRTIAKAIESALHKTYEDKHLRGGKHPINHVY